MKTKILITILVGLLVISAAAPGMTIPANDKAKEKAKAAPENSPVIELIDENWNLEVGGPDVLIGFTQAPGPSEQALVHGQGGVIKYSYRLVPAIAASIPETAIAGLLQNPHVTGIELDGTVYALDELDNSWGVQRIGAGTVHNGGNLGTEVKVAIIDTGTDYTHPDLNANFDVTNLGYDFVNGDNDPMDDEGHGTHVAGSVAAEKDGVGVVGVAPGANLYALKVLGADGSGSWSDVIAAMQWTVDNGVQVANLSLGSSLNPGGIVQTAFNNAEAAGVVIVAAAGNSGNPKGKGNNVGYPARYDSVIAVAATDYANDRARFSSTGDQVELAAPGVDIYSTYMNDSYAVGSGTSMASPHVAGTAALVIAAGITDADGDGRINDEVRSVMNETADDLGAAGRDTLYGFGLVNAAAAVAAVGPPAPAVNVVLSTDKTNYVSGTDTTAVLTAVVSDETSAAITGLASTAFATTLNAASVSVTFIETVTAGTHTGNLDISGLADGTHTVEVTVTDTRSVPGSDSASFTFGPEPTEPTTASVASITYATEGGKNHDKHLLVTVALVDDLGNPVAGASVSIKLDNTTAGRSWTGTGTTRTDGKVTFSLKNAPSGCYTTTVTNVTAGELSWDGVTPANEFCK